jgi:hypothetical protein
MGKGADAGFSQQQMQQQFEGIARSNPSLFGSIPAIGGMDQNAFNAAILGMSPSQIKQYNQGLRQIKGLGGAQGIATMPFMF